MKKLPNFTGLPNVHGVMKDQHNAVVVRHPPLPGQHMMPASQDYSELPAGSRSPKNPSGGVTGALGPYQSEQGAEGGEYTNG